MSAMTDTPTTKTSWYFTVAAVLFIFVLVGVYSSRMAHDTTGYDYEQAQIRLATLHKMQATDRKTLTTADWIDKDKGIVRIPLAEAMTQEVPVLAAKPLTMGTAIPGATVMNTIPATNAPSAMSAPATNAAPSGSPAAPNIAGAKAAHPAAVTATNAAPTGNARPTTQQPTK
jgi:hypothetical protein